MECSYGGTHTHERPFFYYYLEDTEKERERERETRFFWRVSTVWPPHLLFADLWRKGQFKEFIFLGNTSWLLYWLHWVSYRRISPSIWVFKIKKEKKEIAGQLFFNYWESPRRVRKTDSQIIYWNVFSNIFNTITNQSSPKKNMGGAG